MHFRLLMASPAPVTRLVDSGAAIARRTARLLNMKRRMRNQPMPILSVRMQQHAELNTGYPFHSVMAETPEKLAALLAFFSKYRALVPFLNFLLSGRNNLYRATTDTEHPHRLPGHVVLHQKPMEKSENTAT